MLLVARLPAALVREHAVVGAAPAIPETRIDDLELIPRMAGGGEVAGVEALDLRYRDAELRSRVDQLALAVRCPDPRQRSMAGIEAVAQVRVDETQVVNQ